MFVTLNTTLEYVNERGGTITMAPGSVIWPEVVDEETANDIISERQSGINGEIFISSSLAPRMISVSGRIGDAANMQTHKNALVRVFNPSLAGTLKHTDLRTGEVREIDCRVEGVAKVYWSNNEPRFDINLKCLNPFWRGAERAEIISLLQKKFKFPFSTPPVAEGGFIFARRVATLQSQFYNVGDADAGFRALFLARGGSVSNPWVQDLTTGDKIKINFTMAKGDTVEFYSHPQRKRIIINGTENGMRYLDPDNSAFFMLPVGSNIIGYNADVNALNLEVIVFYTPMYLGA